LLEKTVIKIVDKICKLGYYVSIKVIKWKGTRVKKVRIGMMLESMKHSEDLIRRIAEMTSGLEFVMAEPGSEECPEADYIVTDELVQEYFPVSLLIAEMASELGETFQTLIRGEAAGTHRTYLIRSRWGGCGCTAAGLTIARILAGRSGGRVAFICGSPGDIAIYAEEAEWTRSSRELEYRLCHGLDTDAAKYGVNDRYGVTIFAAERRKDRLAEWLKNQGFSAIVTDAGCIPEDSRLAGQAVINIESCGDSRSQGFEQQAAEETAAGSREYYILNKAPYRLAREHFFMVAADDSSFAAKNGKVEIAMDGSFAASLGEVVTAAERKLDDGQSDFYK